VVAVASCLGIIYRIATVAFPIIRKYRLRTKASLCEDLELKIISRYANFGDWFVLHQLSKNMDPLIFADLLKDLAYHLKKNGANAVKHLTFATENSESANSTVVRGVGFNRDNNNFHSEPLYDIVHAEEDDAA
jgi:hypothetical protein